MKRVRPIVRWPGGKSRMLKKLLPMIPPHECYAEAFGGGMALLLAKEKSAVEVVNDINKDLVSLYRNVQYHMPELLREMEFIQNARTNIADFIAQPGLTEIQRAARWFVRNRTSFGGGMTSFAVAKSGGGGCGSKARIKDLIAEINERLSAVSVENLPYDRFINLYDGPNTFFFLDPPYIKSDVHTYEGFSEDEMGRLAKLLRKLKGKWLLTVDDHPVNRELFKGCRIESVVTRNARVNVRKQNNATFGELIICP
ncbi:MAG TPA: DNA adenine methylase [Verrucomicrobiae bacterium]